MEMNGKSKNFYTNILQTSISPQEQSVDSTGTIAVVEKVDKDMAWPLFHLLNPQRAGRMFNVDSEVDDDQHVKT